MHDAIQKLQSLVDKQKRAIEAQRAESERIKEERQQKSINETALSSRPQSQPPNK